MNENVSALLSSLDAVVLNKIKEIIEEKLHRSLAELEDLRVSQFYQRLVNQGTVRYEPRPLYALETIFLHTRNVHHVTFSLTDEKWGSVALLPREEFLRDAQRDPNAK